MQNTWKTYDQLGAARRALRGRTKTALELINQQLFKDESATFVATAAVNAGMSWDDGAIVLSDQRLHVAGCNEFGLALAFNVALSHGMEFLELKETPPGARFKVVGLDAVQGILLTRPAFEQLQGLVDAHLGNMPDSNRPSDPAATEAGPAELLQQLASLRDAGILTHEEFDTKKVEILRRI